MPHVVCQLLQETVDVLNAVGGTEGSTEHRHPSQSRQRQRPFNAEVTDETQRNLLTVEGDSARARRRSPVLYMKRMYPACTKMTSIRSSTHGIDYLMR